MNNPPLNGGGGGGSGFDREREMDDQRPRHLHPEDLARQEHERKRKDSEQQHREPYQPSSIPHHSSAGSIPIHQPVASRISSSIHSPGGLLANHGGPPPSSIPLGAPSGITASFGGPLHAESGRSSQHGGPGATSGPQHNSMFGPLSHGPGGPGSNLVSAGNHSSLFGGPLQQDSTRNATQDAAQGMQQVSFGSGVGLVHQVPGGPGGVSQAGGQQPILNDALSYLDQVKVQFHEQPDVYNKFLDIMKDFKSQTIDTPGVISRVSELFAGHPNLIQGFNTFLPPGYRIECGLENNPNSIRVTTPSGSTIQTIGHGPAPIIEPAPSAVPPAHFPPQHATNWTRTVQTSVESPEAQFSLPAANAQTAFIGPTQSVPFKASSPNQQRSAPAANGSGPATSLGPGVRKAHTPTPRTAQGPPALNGSAGQQANMEKRGPVEFNHAISYVNKIKNRFQDKPEIYKQFLEILQTYQRESKPIQEVYGQVTTLFHTAPDLLEDFKQFLPDSTTKQPGAQRPEDAMMHMAAQTPQPVHVSREGAKMPPVGNFAPPSATKEGSKKRLRPNDKVTGPSGTATSQDPPVSSMRSTLPAQPSYNKRTKTTHKSGVAEGSFVEPTLTPVMPEPLGPPSTSVSVQEDTAFFDKLKKHINSKQTFGEFLKLCNMFLMDLITADALLYKASQFTGNNTELLSTLRNMINGRVEEEGDVENQPDPPTGRVSLSNCRGFGPSYRLLPKRERLKPCSGRDELCNSVLNDQWASHPTWASEDSGFVSHRKNGYEEGLHRIEEERHDYDFYIEINQKCIQLLEPIAHQMLSLPESERANFKMPPGLGGQSTSIYKRVLKKIYGHEAGITVTNDMFQNPFSVVPIVMARLKQKDEEWRFTQREWEKIWQSQTRAMHLKSLDHMGIQVKSNDKRNLSAKHLVDAIKIKYEEQRRLRLAKGVAPRHQFLYQFQDQDLLLDLLRFMMIFATVGGQHNAVERRRILDFFELFVPQFFDLPEDKVQERIADIDQDSADEDDDDPTPPELVNGRCRRHGKKSDLLRGVLDPSRNGSRTRVQKDDSSGSKETTPDMGSANEEDMHDCEEAALPELFNDRWLPTVPGPVIVATTKDGRQEVLNYQGELKAEAPFSRKAYNFYCNQNIFVFFSVFQALYKRLEGIKKNPQSVKDEISREKAEKPAKILGPIQEEAPYFEDDDETSFWPRTVELIEDYINGEIDETRYQDILRKYYLKNGWTLYTIQDLLKNLCRLGLSCNNPDTKGEKTKELFKAYLESRQQDETSFQKEISARKYAEKCIKDGEMFVITWYPNKKETTVRWLEKDDMTFYMDKMQRIQQWQYYIASYIRVEPTEGIVRPRMQKVLLARNLPAEARDGDDGLSPMPVTVSEGLIIRICLNTLRMVFDKGTTDYFIYPHRSAPFSSRKNGTSTGAPGTPLSVADAAVVAERETEKRAVARRRDANLAERRVKKFKEKMCLNSSWMRDVTQTEVQAAKETFDKRKHGPETLLRSSGE